MTELLPPYRFDGSQQRPRLSPTILALPWLGPREVAEAHAWPMLPLGGTPSVDLPDHIVEAVIRSARHPEYPGTLGASDLRNVIAERVGDELGMAIDPNRDVLITVGSMQALHLAAAVCTRGAGRAVAHAPSFFYEDVVAAAGGSCEWTGGEDGRPDWAALAASIDDGVSTVFVNTPVNPTGYVFDEQDLDRLASAVHGHPVWVISDEAYETFVHDGRRHISPATHPDLRDQTLVIRSFSKTYALGAWRAGFAVGPEPLISAMAKLLQHSVIGVATIVQAAVYAAYTGPQDWVDAIVRRLGETRLRVVEAVNQTGFMLTEVPEAGTTVWARIVDERWTEDSLSHMLGRDHGIPAVQGRLFGATGPHLRIPFSGLLDAADDLVLRLNALA
jgi:aspartate/methionine/tyrosine aminotransferase